MTTPLFETLCVIGPGLIGSSVLRRLRERPGLVNRLVVADRDPAVLDRVRALDLGDEITADLAKAVADADCVMLCVPVGAIAPVAEAIMPHFKAGAILTDVGSTRRSVVDALTPHLRDDIAYIPAHPMAGTEHSGPDAGFASLFEDRWCLLTPDPHAPQTDIDRLAAFWREMGARIRIMDVDHHDTICAMVSHLPHLIAFTICGTADTLAEDMRAEVLDFAASGFRDFTRIAASDPTMWRDIFLNNSDALLSVLDRFSQDAAAMAKAIREGDEKTIVDTISRGRRIRRSLLENRQA
ncbi:prephenate dehydrogenase/arogenate dehydrogenase family protein [Asaia bogorensis]|uniref:prephenate dehydrogenase n=1 Tax=Asaia bogorensis NBRC 16594 TaxID=1231624 RepID=A0AAN4R3Z0_9PROT|nr:prephenate dehydrogenase/arogenate dehydrogenase family protein [Asaia bogorensis]BAT20849.1 cyclohexadienyl/arogenate/prephenate dehydrogenase [Asaia bogorensis NBRC 16594]GBQ77001.1 cyclohexadienyl/arogenate/prephenate dehydrogenase [Asaia bogorensis NBRC 16594]GEL54753.1 cyclohexadienyl dehydrogenase [Asaia bogorensis NBRC 16594]